MADKLDTVYTVYLPYNGGRYYVNMPTEGFLPNVGFKIWGAGGGGGAADSQPGGSGAGGGFVSGTMNVIPGQLIEVYVGQGGGAGTSGTSTGGGTNGKSVTGFSGGSGGKAGQSGWSGGGGGGGGATVIKIGGYPRAIAGGGGGGGGGGNNAPGESAGPYFNHTFKDGLTNADQGKGWGGEHETNDGGGGGGGGGGNAGGSGGRAGDGDVGGGPGANGTNGRFGEQPLEVGEYGNYKIPGGYWDANYVSGVGTGGTGQAASPNSSQSYYPWGGTNGAWCELLNNTSVWQGNGSYTWRVYFPVTGSYEFDLSVDNYGYMYLDDVEMVYAGTYNTYFGRVWTVQAGWHTVRIDATNTGGPGAVGGRILKFINGGTATEEMWNTRAAINPVETSPTSAEAGGNGYAILTFYRSSGFYVKTGGTYKRILPKLKVNSAYTNRISSWVKINGAWRSVNNNLTVNMLQDSYSWGDAGVISAEPPPLPTYVSPAADGGGGYSDGGGGFDSGGGGGCFIGSTLITLADGTFKPIDQINIGDYVMDALGGPARKVTHVKITDHDISRWVFSLSKDVKPFITEEHPFYNEQGELCAMSELCTELAPWLGKVKIVDVPNKVKLKKSIPVYNLMLESGESHYANGVPVNNIIKNGTVHVFVQQGVIDQQTYEDYVYSQEAMNMPPHIKRIFFKGAYVLSNHVAKNPKSLSSKLIIKVVKFGFEHRVGLSRAMSAWINNPVRKFVIGLFSRKPR